MARRSKNDKITAVPSKPVSSLPEYEAWRAMVARCYHPRNRNYPVYGAKGITVCDRWRENFEAFHADMGDRPSSEHSLDRIDNRRGYEPGNVRWATRREQQNNTRATKFLTFDGKTRGVSEWARELGLTPGVLHRRLARGWSVDRALTTPVDKELALTKLLQCQDCLDIVKVWGEAPGRRCRCGKSQAGWLDQSTIAVRGPGRIIALPNEDLRDARPITPGKYRGPYYRWFLIPDSGDVVKRTDDE